MGPVQMVYPAHWASDPRAGRAADRLWPGRGDDRRGETDPLSRIDAPDRSLFLDQELSMASYPPTPRHRDIQQGRAAVIWSRLVPGTNRRLGADPTKTG